MSRSRHLLGLWLALVTAGAVAPAHALTGASATSAYDAVGAFNGTNGVLIDDRWVLTAAHVARGVAPGTLSFSSGAGSAVVDAIYFAGSDNYPGNDLALLHLSSALDAAGTPVLASQVLNTVEAATFGTLTLVSAQNTPPKGVAEATALTAVDHYTDGNGTAYTTNWLITTGPSHLESGDSGSGAFSGSVADSGGSVLMGIASAQLTAADNSQYSAYVQVGAYRSWIDSTLAASGDAASWTSPVPDAPGLALITIGLPAVLRRRRG